jgi:spermidine synthase
VPPPARLASSEATAPAPTAIGVATRRAVVVLFTATGFSALALQVVWQRVLALHAGVDLPSITTVVAAFLGGLGVGNLLGGVLADRLDRRTALAAFGCANIGIGVFAWASMLLFDDLYRSLASDLAGTGPTFAFNAALLVVPTTLMGLSLPLVARGVVERVEDAGPLVGRLYSWNTLGAAAGAAVTGWVIAGSIGFTATVRLAGSLNLAAAAVALAWAWRSPSPAAPARSAASGVDAATAPEASAPDLGGSDVDEEPAVAGAAGRVGTWYALYALTGAIALGLEVVFFRLIDAIMRGNAYTFGHVLTLYLLLFGVGGAIGSRIVGRVRRPDQWFLALQGAAGGLALGGVVLLLEGPALVGLDDEVDRYFAGSGFTDGYPLDTGGDRARFLFAHLGAPLLVMGLPVLAIGASFPFVQALVTRRLEVLGRRTGGLLFANIVGNVAGTLLAGFVLMGALGTAGTLVLLAGGATVLAVVAAARWRRWPAAVGVAVLAAVLVLATPSNEDLWAALHGARDQAFAVEEDRACVTTMRPPGALSINGNPQNGYPFDDFHLLIGLAPAVAHPAPSRSLSIGLGIGATPYGMLLDQRIDHVETVELCGRLGELLEGLAADGAPELQRLFADPRFVLRTGDGRATLHDDGERYDIITVDALRPRSSSSGALYSVEFYELARDRLAPGGIVAGWASSTRTVNSVTEVFPHVSLLSVPSYLGLVFFLASDEPLVLDAAVLADRLGGASLDTHLTPEQAASLRGFFAAPTPICARAGPPTGPVADNQLNHDLFPRDEYFLNNPDVVPVRPPC